MQEPLGPWTKAQGPPKGRVDPPLQAYLRDFVSSMMCFAPALFWADIYDGIQWGATGLSEAFTKLSQLPSKWMNKKRNVLQNESDISYVTRDR